VSAIFSIQLPRRASRIVGGIAVTVVMTAGAAGLSSAPSGATPPTQDGTVAAGYAGHWLAAQVNADGSVHDANDHPSPGSTLGTALGLASAGTEQATFNRTVTWLSDHVDAVTGTGATAAPGQIGYLLLVVDAAGRDATTFGGVNLVTRLAGTLGQFESGLYGQADPTYDGAFRQSLAILGLDAVGGAQGAGTVSWLAGQQCGGVDLATEGGWEAYRAPATACTAPDLNLFSGVDTNSTAIAFEALTAAGVTPASDALGWLDRSQNATGGWGFLPGLDDDPDSTGLVVQAIVAGGQSPTSGVWVEGTHNALSALLAFQLGCDAPAADRGAFTFPGGGQSPNALATQQAVWGASGHAFPLGVVTFGATPDPCAPVVPTTSTSTTTVSDTVAAVPVAVTPAFTG
jgi:hypothetical protein